MIPDIPSIIQNEHEVSILGNDEIQTFLAQIRILISGDNPVRQEIFSSFKNIPIFFLNCSTNFFSIESGALGIDKDFKAIDNFLQKVLKLRPEFNQSLFNKSVSILWWNYGIICDLFLSFFAHFLQ